MSVRNRLVTVALAGLSAFGAACNGPGEDPNDCDYFMTAGLNNSGTPIPLATDRNCPDNLVAPMTVRVELLAQGGASQDPPPASTLEAFYVSRYEVTYINRRTGGTVVGVDVPRPYSFDLPFAPSVAPMVQEVIGTSFLTAQQKVEPPLNNGSLYAAGALELTAVVTVFGYPTIDPGRLCNAEAFSYQFSVVDGPGC